MDDPFSSFWQQVRSIRLTEAESHRVAAGIRAKTGDVVRREADACLTRRMDPRSFLRREAKRVQLSPSEEADVRTHIERFMEAHPLPPIPDTFKTSGDVWNVFRTLMFVLRPLPVTLAAVVLLIGVGASASFAAQSALPGDFLYPVKVRFNEKARAALYFSTDSRAHFEAVRLENRLEEAAQLAAAGRLRGALRSDVSRTINSQLALTQQAAVALMEGGDPDAALDVHSQVESDLIANAAVLAALAETSASTKSDLRDLLRDISQAEHDATIVRAKTEQRVTANAEADPHAAAEGAIQSATMRLQEARSFIESNRATADPRILIQADARFDFAKRMFSNARGRINAEQYDEAIRIARQAQRAGQEAKAMLRVSATVHSRQ